MDDDDEKLLRAHVTTLWETCDDLDLAIDLIVRFVKGMRHDEVALWKDRYQTEREEADLWEDRWKAEREAHEATIKHAESEGRR